MGRPLNKKFFNAKPAGAVGEGVASYTITNPGAYTAKPTVSVSAPALPGGVSATLGTVSMRALSATVSQNGTGAAEASYVPGDTLTLAGTTGTAAVFTVTATEAETFGIDTMGTTVWTTGDTITFGPGNGWSVAAVVTITANAGSITGTSNIVPGTYTGTDPIQAVAPTSTTVADGGGYQAGSLFSLGMRVKTISLTTAGNMTVIPANPAATTTDSTTGGTGATLTVSYGVLSVPVSASGSGYISAADAAITFAPASTTAATAVLTTSTSNVILAHARVVGSGSVLDADIAKQVSTNDYVMTTTDGTSKVALTTTNTPAAGGAYIVATDANGSTYWVTKLTAHRATLVRRSMNGSYLHATGATATWSFDSPSLLRVQIENV